MDGDIVTSILPLQELPNQATVTITDDILAPGFFDIQVNGGGGVMLNNMPTREGVQHIARTHNALGTAWLLPTVITDTPDILEQAAAAVTAELGQNGVLGIHIEGPHINRKYKGIHNPAFIRPFDSRMMETLEKLRKNQVPVLLTLAIETVEPGLIRQLTDMGIIVSAGHTAANAEQTEDALEGGLRCFTHLFNGMPQMTSRAPMITGTAINSEAWCGIIADGYHVADAMIMLAIRARPVDNRMILVSDAMSTVGGPNELELYGETIRVDGGRLVNSWGSLAGAHITLRESVRRMVYEMGIPLEYVIRMASINPFEMMKLDSPGIVGQYLRCLARIHPRTVVTPTSK